MGTVKHRFGPRDAEFPASNYAQFRAVAGSNFGVESLGFDTTTEESCYFKFPAVGYGSGNLTITVRWYSNDGETTGGVTFGASLCAITPNQDTQDIETDTFATEVTASDTHLGTTGQRLHEMTISLTNLDSLGAEDWCVLKLARKPSDGSDTMAGDCNVVEVGIDYSDT